MKKLTAVAIATVMLAGGATGALADDERGEGRYEMRHQNDHYSMGHHGYGDHGHKRACGSIDRMADLLNLDEKQVAKLRAIKDKYRPQKRALKDKARENSKALRVLMEKDSAKESEIRKLADAQGKIKADMIVLHMKKKLEMQEVLTREQRAKWKETRESRGYRR